MSNSKCSRLEGRVAVVTGGASGIGLASVRRLADEGAHIVIGDLDPVSGEAAAAEVNGTFIRTDVTSAETLRRQRGVRVLARSDGTLLALFESTMWLQRLEGDHPELVLERLVAEGLAG